jgi:hypothetical protein
MSVPYWFAQGLQQAFAPLKEELGFIKEELQTMNRRLEALEKNTPRTTEQYRTAPFGPIIRPVIQKKKVDHPEVSAEISEAMGRIFRQFKKTPSDSDCKFQTLHQDVRVDHASFCRRAWDDAALVLLFWKTAAKAGIVWESKGIFDGTYSEISFRGKVIGTEHYSYKPEKLYKLWEDVTAALAQPSKKKAEPITATEDILRQLKNAPVITVYASRRLQQDVLIDGTNFCRRAWDNVDLVKQFWIEAFRAGVVYENEGSMDGSSMKFLYDGKVIGSEFYGDSPEALYKLWEDVTNALKQQ